MQINHVNQTSNNMLDKAPSLQALDDGQAVRRRIVVIICLAGGTCGLLAFGVYYLLGVPLTAPLITTICLTSAYFVFPLLLKTNLPTIKIALICFLWMELILFVTAFSFGGLMSPVFPWFGAVPILTVYFLRKMERVAVLGTLALGLIALAAFDATGYVFASPIPPDALPKVYFGSTIFCVLFICIITHVFTTLSRRSYERLKMAKSEAVEKRYQAEWANAAKTQFLASMSHELRTPLNAIIGFSDLIQHQALGPIGNVKYAEYNTDIYDSASHLLAVIDDLLQYSQLELGKIKISESSIVVSDIILGAMKMVQFRPETSLVSFEHHQDENMPLLFADARLTKQILINLLTNALKFLGDRGTITVSANVDCEGRICISVGDTGLGISPLEIDKVTEPFYKSKNTGTKNTEGVGLGLSIVREFMTLHSGDLTIKSKDKSGTRVTCTFPLWRTLDNKRDAVTASRTVP